MNTHLDYSISHRRRACFKLTTLNTTPTHGRREKCPLDVTTRSVHDLRPSQFLILVRALLKDYLELELLVRVFHGRWPESLRLLGADLLVHVLLAQPRRQSTELSHEPSQFVDSLDQFLLRLRHVHDVVYRSVEFLLGHDFLLLKFGRPGLVLLELLGGFRQPRLLVGGRGGANTGEGGRRESRRGRPEEGSSIASRGCGREGHISRRSGGGVRCDERRGGSGESEKDGGELHGFPSLLFGGSVAILCKR
mmetsp:Transcript_59682/g.176847  ORF Transcript_59682/g.176847 Transcript_59682/m.176847 type:complete len:250 (-) Transcript_59682:41-790(-)